MEGKIRSRNIELSIHRKFDTIRYFESWTLRYVKTFESTVNTTTAVVHTLSMWCWQKSQYQGSFESVLTLEEEGGNNKNKQQQYVKSEVQPEREGGRQGQTTWNYTGKMDKTI